MRSMLEFLFASDITCPGSWREEHQLGKKVDEVINLHSQVETIVQQEHPGLRKIYQEKARALQNRNCQAEFERGFLVAADLALEVFRRVRDMEQ